MRKIQYIIKDSDYKDDWFNPAYVDILESKIIEKEARGGKIVYKTICLIRQKEIFLSPEEVVRQLYLMVLTIDYGYSKDRIQLEYPVSFGTEKKRADIVILQNDLSTPLIIVEINKPKFKEGKELLKSYCNATSALIGVWTNGHQISYYHRKTSNYYNPIPDIPHANQGLQDILTERWNMDDLVAHDKLSSIGRSLKDLILEMEDEVLANAGVDVFEELFKLIFTKLYDELESGRNSNRFLEFRNYGETENDLKFKIEKLFQRARNRWEGIFQEGDKIEITPSHLAICVATLEGVKLFNSNLDVIDEAFEYLINKTSKGDKGQYFTPRYVIDMCVKMLNPQENEYIIDTAAGSCGFPVHTFFYVRQKIRKEEGIEESNPLLTTGKPLQREENYVKEKVFAIDFDERAVRVGRTLNLIAGDGQTNVLRLNTLDWERWKESTDDDKIWIDTYYSGWERLKKLRRNRDSNRFFNFDILMANPPFAGDIKETRTIAKYDLGKKADGKWQSAVGRDILFIERNLDFLKPGGRMAVVLPQGRFNNSSDKFLREYITSKCRILAVVGLHGNVFKPHTGTKTSVLFLQKWNDNANDGPLCPHQDDYPIFFATMQEPSKDNRGDKIYLAKEDGTPKRDNHKHLIVKHDLFNHDDLTQDGIAEAFIQFAKKEKLPFWLGKQSALSTK